MTFLHCAWTNSPAAQKKKEGTVARPTHDMAAMDASETGGFEFDPAPQMLAKKRLHGTHEC